MTDKKLTRRQEAGLQALLANPCVRDAAEAIGVAENTLHRWLGEKAFAAAYREARHQAMQHTLGHLQASSQVAVDTLKDVMKNPEAPASSRVSAARAVLDFATRLAEVEQFEERLAVVEEALGELEVKTDAL